LGEEVLRDTDGCWRMGYKEIAKRTTQSMSEEQLSALLAKLKEDAGLQKRLKGASDLVTAVAIAKDAGFDVSKADWHRYQANQILGLSDEDLESVAGGKGAASLSNNPLCDRCTNSACMSSDPCCGS
jgi:predicted ribosomally synthesized peptide with nif11-like leader